MPNKTQIAEWLLCRAGHDHRSYKEFIEKRNHILKNFTKQELIYRVHTHTRAELNARYMNDLEAKNKIDNVELFRLIYHISEGKQEEDEIPFDEAGGPEGILINRFGMNAFWATYPDRFEEYMDALLDNVFDHKKDVLRRFVARIEDIGPTNIMDQTQRDLAKMLKWENENKL